MQYPAGNFRLQTMPFHNGVFRMLQYLVRTVHVYQYRYLNWHWWYLVHVYVLEHNSISRVYTRTWHDWHWTLATALLLGLTLKHHLPGLARDVGLKMDVTWDVCALDFPCGTYAAQCQLFKTPPSRNWSWSCMLIVPDLFLPSSF